jgi:putative transposase
MIGEGESLSPLGEALRRLAVRWRGNKLPEVLAQGVSAALPLRVQHEVPQAGFGGAHWGEGPRAGLGGMVEILKSYVRADHVHLLLLVLPNLAPSKVMQVVKEKSSHHLLQDFKALRQEFWDRHLWARGYFVATTGSVSDEVIAKYIEAQDVEPQEDEVFKVSG